MKGWNIFAHSVRLVFGNLKNAIQIGLVPVVILVAIVIALFSASGLSYSVLSDESAMEEAIGAGLIGVSFFLIWLVAMVITFWIFVSWHRFVLLEEYPTGWIPPFHFDRILSYLGHGLLLTLIGLGLLLPVGLVLMLVGTASGVVAPVFFFAALLGVVLVIYRLVPIMPAAAIGRPLKLADAWNATRGANGTIIALLIITFLAQFVLQLIAGIFLAVFGPLGVLVQLAATFAMSLINVSILTTMYGHYIEGRAID